MANRSTDMQAIFNELSEANKDIVILIAKTVKVTQNVTKQLCENAKQTSEETVSSGSKPERIIA